MARRVSENAKYDDVCFCMKSSCEFKECFRHPCHAAYPKYMTMAVLENEIGYCLKVEDEEKKYEGN